MPDSAQLNPSDPHRRIRRHRYQEGPGFLFLATQNGRPTQPRNQAKQLDKVRFRMRAVRLAGELGPEAASAQLGISPRSLYRWLAAYKAAGIEALVERSRKPKRLRKTIPAWVDMVIVAIRLHTYWNSKRIAAEMSRRQIYQVSPDHIDQLFRDQGCSRGTVPRPPGPRYERSRPNELWHIDIKGPFFINLGTGDYIKTWIVGLVDDHSRFLVGLRILTEAKALPIVRWMDECFELCGQPLQLMSDNGKPFVGWLPSLLSSFGKRLAELHVQHLRTQITSPWTNGKIEAFWDILQAEVLDRERFASLAQAEAALARFAEYYNYHRLSSVLGWLTPAERYHGTPFTDRGFENIPALTHLQPWLREVMDAA
jgi:transposase InsO family protein